MQKNKIDIPRLIKEERLHYTIKKQKYKNQKTIYNNIKFDSKGESERYIHLKVLENNKQIKNLVLQKEFILQEKFLYKTKIQHKISYYCDFEYFCNTRNKIIIEDFKSPYLLKNQTFCLKKKILFNLLKDKNIDFVIVMKNKNTFIETTLTN